MFDHVIRAQMQIAMAAATLFVLAPVVVGARLAMLAGPAAPAAKHSELRRMGAEKTAAALEAGVKVAIAVATGGDAGMAALRPAKRRVRANLKRLGKAPVRRKSRRAKR